VFAIIRGKDKQATYWNTSLLTDVEKLVKNCLLVSFLEPKKVGNIGPSKSALSRYFSTFARIALSQKSAHKK